MARGSSSGCFNILKLFRRKKNKVSEVSTYNTFGYQLVHHTQYHATSQWAIRYVFILTMEDILMICVVVYFPAYHIQPLLWFIKVDLFVT